MLHYKAEKAYILTEAKKMLLKWNVYVQVFCKLSFVICFVCRQHISLL